jgi:hypothetical protein
MSARRRAASGAIVIRSSIPSAPVVLVTSNETGCASTRASAARDCATIPRIVVAQSLAAEGTSPVGSPDHGVSSSFKVRSWDVVRAGASATRSTSTA